MVMPLVVELLNYGLKVWFDRFSLNVGDSPRQSNTSAGIASVAKSLVEVIRPEAFALKTSQTDSIRAVARLREQLRQRCPKQAQVRMRVEHREVFMNRCLPNPSGSRGLAVCWACLANITSVEGAAAFGATLQDCRATTYTGFA